MRRKTSSEKRDGIRKARWQEDMPDRAYHLAMLGLTNKQIAVAFGVSVIIFDNWKILHPALDRGLVMGRAEADTNVVVSLYKRATGYWTKDTKVFVHKGQVITKETDKEIIPDVEAIKFWLKNRQPENWNETFKHEHSGQINVETNAKKWDLTDLSEEEFEVAKKMGLPEMLKIQNEER